MGKINVGEIGQMLQLDPNHVDAIKGHGEAAYPHECCGLLLGRTGIAPQSLGAGDLIAVKDADSTSQHTAATDVPASTPNATANIVVELWPTQNAWNSETQAAMAQAAMEQSAAEGPAEQPVEQTVEETGTVSTLTTERRYWIDPRDMLAAQKYGRERGLDIIGVYHSHPDHLAVPSECDRRCAWSDYSYIIVAVRNGQSVDVRSWSLNADGYFEAERITTTRISDTGA